MKLDDRKLLLQVCQVKLAENLNLAKLSLLTDNAADNLVAVICREGVAEKA